MKKMIIVLIGIIFSLQLHAQDIPPKMQLIIKQTMAANGYLTKESHDEFWLEMKKIGPEEKVEQLTNTMEASLLFGQEYQKELWTSALHSYENKKVIKTKRLLELEKESIIRFKASLPYPKGSKSYDLAIESYNRNMQNSNENAKLLLEASANHIPLTSVQGQVINIDKQYIEKVLTTISGSFERLKNLFDKDWDGKKSQ